MNRADLRAEVMAHQVAPGAYTGRVNDLLNEALRRVARQVRWYGAEDEYAIPVVGGQASYPWPADFGKLRFVRDERGGTLRRLSLRRIDEAGPRAGHPVAYAVSRAALTLAPTPTGPLDLRMRYWALPPLMTDDADEPALPEDYHRLLPLWALKRSFEVEDDMEMAAYWRAEWESALRELEVDVRFPTDDGPRQARDMWEGL